MELDTISSLLRVAAGPATGTAKPSPMPDRVRAAAPSQATSTQKWRDTLLSPNPAHCNSFQVLTLSRLSLRINLKGLNSEDRGHYHDQNCEGSFSPFSRPSLQRRLASVIDPVLK